MKHYFIQKQDRPHLILFFAGWGMDEHPFIDYAPANSDLLLCYDYRSPEFDFTLLKEYESIRLIAWSMGVWAASQVLQHAGLPISESIAVNGTMTPVSEDKGISGTIFEGTLNGLNEATLRKFLRRMCGSGDALNLFLAKRPQRPVEELKEELFLIGKQAEMLPVSDFEWSKAVVCNCDLIFTPDNQQQAWQAIGTEIEEHHLPHYSEELLRKIICGE